MVGLIFHEGISTCYVGFIRGEQEISFGHDEGHVRCFFYFYWLEFGHTRQNLRFWLRWTEIGRRRLKKVLY